MMNSKPLGATRISPPAGMLRGVEVMSCSWCQITLPEYGKEPEGQADPHCWTEEDQTRRKGEQLLKKMRKDGEVVERWCPRDEVCHPEQ